METIAPTANFNTVNRPRPTHRETISKRPAKGSSLLGRPSKAKLIFGGVILTGITLLAGGGYYGDLMLNEPTFDGRWSCYAATDGYSKSDPVVIRDLVMSQGGIKQPLMPNQNIVQDFGLVAERFENGGRALRSLSVAPDERSASRFYRGANAGAGAGVAITALAGDRLQITHFPILQTREAAQAEVYRCLHE